MRAPFIASSLPTPEIASVAALRATSRRRDAAPYAGLDSHVGLRAAMHPTCSASCPQWHDIFIDGALEFHTESARTADPRLRGQRRSGQSVLQATVSIRCASREAYEADPALFAMLKSNLAAHRASDVEAVHAALWTTNGRVTFRAEGSDFGHDQHTGGRRQRHRRRRAEPPAARHHRCRDEPTD